MNMNVGSVSHGTMRPEDLIPCFLWELEHQKPLRREHRKLAREIRSHMDSEDYYESEESTWDLESLFEALGEYAPKYFYFGSHPGDGSDFGYWLAEEWEDYLLEDGGIRVNDVSDIPSDHVGDVAVVNDHGNITLYRRGRNHKLYKVWDIA